MALDSTDWLCSLVDLVKHSCDVTATSASPSLGTLHRYNAETAIAIFGAEAISVVVSLGHLA